MAYTTGGGSECDVRMSDLGQKCFVLLVAVDLHDYPYICIVTSCLAFNMQGNIKWKTSIIGRHNFIGEITLFIAVNVAGICRKDYLLSITLGGQLRLFSHTEEN